MEKEITEYTEPKKKKQKKNYLFGQKIYFAGLNKIQLNLKKQSRILKICFQRFLNEVA
jgi:hypothetical protein